MECALSRRAEVRGGQTEGAARAESAVLQATQPPDNGASMICNYCGKARCVHGSPEDSAHRAAVQAKIESVVESKPRSGTSLFQLFGLGTLECVLCRWVAPTGPYQPILRIQHGR